MLHFYDECIESIATQCTRLAPALALTHAGIPCLVWAEDALSFVYFVLTSLFALQLLVPDEQLENAARAITQALPYTRMVGPAPAWLEFKYVDPTRPSCFPCSIHLQSTTPVHLRKEDDPVDIYLHPESFFALKVEEQDRTVSLANSLPAEYSLILFPTRTAFLDSLFNTLLDPPSGIRVVNFTSMLDVYIGYITFYTLRAQPRVLPNGELESEHASVRDSLWKEHQAIFECRIRGQKQGWLIEMLQRREFMNNTM